MECMRDYHHKSFEKSVEKIIENETRKPRRRRIKR
jgi:hypothetical protein